VLIHPLFSTRTPTPPHSILYRIEKKSSKIVLFCVFIHLDPELGFSQAVGIEHSLSTLSPPRTHFPCGNINPLD
jgi:hypothetical protein